MVATPYVFALKRFRSRLMSPIRWHPTCRNRILFLCVLRMRHRGELGTPTLCQGPQTAVNRLRIANFRIFNAITFPENRFSPWGF